MMRIKNPEGERQGNRSEERHSGIIVSSYIVSRARRGI